METQPIEIRHVEKLVHDQPALAEAYRQGLPLQDKGLMHWPAACWDGKAIVARVGGQPVAMINYSVSEDTFIASIDFAYCLPGHPMAFTKCLMVLRMLLRKETRISELRFTYHAGNETMHKAGHLLNAELHSMTFKAAL